MLMLSESAWLLKYARYRFFIIFEAFEFRISFIMPSRADLIISRFLFESVERRGTDELIVSLLTSKPFVWRSTETYDILPGFPYKVSRIRNASYSPARDPTKHNFLHIRRVRLHKRKSNNVFVI